MLPDYLTSNLKVVFVGTAAGELSAARGHYFSFRGNQFWVLLGETGLTGGRVLRPEEDAEVLDYGVGLTDIAKGVAASADSRLAPGDFDVGGFLEKIERYGPVWVAFNGLEAPRVVARYLGERKPRLGYTGFRASGARGFVLPSSSGTNANPRNFHPKASKADWWSDFGDEVRHGS